MPGRPFDFNGMGASKLKLEQSDVAEGTWEPMSCLQSMGLAARNFTLLSLLVFGSWAFQGRWLYRNMGEPGAYLLWTVVFFVGLITLFSRLCWWKSARPHFRWVLGSAFFLYATVWSLIWFLVKIKYADYPGGVLGVAAMTALFAYAFRPISLRIWWRMTWGCALISLVGYGVGGLLFEWMRYSTAGKLAWGAAYGLGFGAGLGYALYLAQYRPAPKQST